MKKSILCILLRNYSINNLKKNTTDYRRLVVQWIRQKSDIVALED